MQSQKLANVLYDIRGPVLEEAKRLEAQGHRIIKLNIGNPHYTGTPTAKGVGFLLWRER
jgi:aspartate/methionine/tyrosine aminotransferase